ncbi:MAG: type II secretion system F family protein [Syntrophaceae bacterium]|nr:type II secretion system F family protein [Syntrophaceae bacterium]
MPIFSYRSTSLDGTITEGMIEAADEKNAAEKLKHADLIPLEIKAPTELGFIARFKLRSAKGDLTIFTTELSTLLSAGLPLDRSLSILADVAEHQTMKEIILSLLSSVRGGSSFSEALQKHPKVFPRIYINMVRAGETGGVLDAVLEKLNEFLETSRELRDHIYSSMIYPSILVITGGVSIIILLTFVLPRFSIIFSEVGAALPASTQFLLAISEMLKSYGWFLLIFFFFVWLVLRKYVATEHGRHQLDAFKLLLMKDLIIKLETARFCRTLGTLLASGVPLLQALNNAKEVIGNLIIASSIDAVSKGAREGQGISIPLSKAAVLPPLALSMIKVGEETAALDRMLIQIATTYEKILKQAVKRFTAILEPVMIITMGLIIGFIVISMLLAVFSITDLPS